MEAVCKYNTKGFCLLYTLSSFFFFFFCTLSIFTLCCQQKVNDSVIWFVWKFPGLLSDLSKSEMFAELYNNFAGQDREDITAITALTIWLILSLAVICSQHNRNNSCLCQQIKQNSNKAWS